ncbi:MAG: D-2-hydroxyacid dehydrogenase [Pirellulaceae bacterium]|nr:D-2-hydroxyacid dehydrogenase [Pirellulaceae bacterium]
MSNWRLEKSDKTLLMETIVLCFPVTDEQIAQIKRSAPDCNVIFAEQHKIAERIFSATIFCGHAKVPIDWEAVVRAGRLRWIQSTAAGLDHCLVPAVIRSEIVVSGSAGLFSRQVAEHTLALLLGMLRGLPSFFHAQSRRDYERLPTNEIQGHRIGILGFGGNGQRIAEYLLPFRPKAVMATDFFASQLDFPGVEIVDPQKTNEVFSNSDIVICTLPLLDATRLSIGSQQFNAMPNGAWFVNVGRGQLIDETALVAALDSGRLSGAAIDVAFDEPPAANSPLWKAGNLLITPHVGAQSRFRVADTVQLFCDNLGRWQRGEPLLNLVDKSLGFCQLDRRLPRDWPQQRFS